MRVLLAAAGEDGAVALVKGGEEETPAPPASVERSACQLLLFVTLEQIAETGENSLPTGSEFRQGTCSPPSRVWSSLRAPAWSVWRPTFSAAFSRRRNLELPD